MLTQRAVRLISHLAARARRIASGQSTQSQSISDDIQPSFVAELEALGLSLDQATKCSTTVLRRVAKRRSRQRKITWYGKLGHWSLDVATGILTSYEMLSVLHGDTNEFSNLLVEVLDHRLVPERALRSSAAVKRCIETGESYALEVEHRRLDGSTFVAYVQGSSVRDIDGRVVKISGIMQDISERNE